MTRDLKIIKQLEKQIGEGLKRISINDVRRNNGYAIDANENVIGLNLWGFNLIDISPLKDLTNLTELGLGGNQLTDISPLKDLTDLTELALDINELTDISPLKELTNLTELSLGGNQLTDISPLKELIDLTQLRLYNNQLTDISPLKELAKLTTLDLINNKISQLHRAIVDLKMEIKWGFDYSGKGIFLEDNPLEEPPVEIVKKGKEAIIAWFNALEGEKKTLNEVKLLLVGDGGAGKTSLVKKLLGEPFNEYELQTHGINIRHCVVKHGKKKEKIKANIWDFGGQEIMHATHQFFLSKRSLYVLVLDGRKDEKVEYWLKHVKSFGGDSPVLVIINKIDQNPGFDLNRPFLQEKYPNIKGFYRLSCATGKGIKTFSQHLRQELAKVELIHTTWPKTWFNVKTHLEKMKDHFISYQRYKQICIKERIGETFSQETLVEFLNDLGVVLHFQEFDLEDTHVLEPRWVTEAVYKIINSGQLVQYSGVLNLRHLDKILQKKTQDDYYYPRDKYRYIITLMKKFELCYGIDDETVLVPDLLPVQEASIELDHAAALKFIIHYDFLPRSVMPRFIVNMHKDIKAGLQWRTGVVLEDKDFQSFAVVKADHEAKRIYMHVQDGQKRDYFAVLLATLRRINRSFEKLETTEMVPMPDEPAVTVDYEHLIRLEQEGIEYYLPGKSKNKYKVKDLLGTIAPAKATEEEILQILRKIKTDTDTMESLLTKANDTIMLQPNIMGFGFDLNALIRKVLPKKKTGQKED